MNKFSVRTKAPEMSSKLFVFCTKLRELYTYTNSDESSCYYVQYKYLRKHRWIFMLLCTISDLKLLFLLFQANHIRDILKKGDDANSELSAESATSDSGRGGSEEDVNSNRGHPLSDSGKHRQTRPLTSSTFSSPPSSSPSSSLSSSPSLKHFSLL